VRASPRDVIGSRGTDILKSPNCRATSDIDKLLTTLAVGAINIDAVDVSEDD
jgi:hypothetical protein